MNATKIPTLTGRFATALMALDQRALEEISADDLAWNIPGNGPVSGVHIGVPAAIAVARTIRESGITIEMQQVLTGRDGVTAILHEVGNRGDKSIDVCVALTLEVRNGRVAAVQGFISDVAGYELHPPTIAPPCPTTAEEIDMKDPATRPTVLLVQGAWHHPDVWLPLRAALFGLGYRTAVTGLPSAGVSPTGSMHDDADTIREVVNSMAGPVAVLAHSYGGIPVTEATAGAPNITQLIYLAAYLPDENGSMFSLHGIPDPDVVSGLFPRIDSPRTSLFADLDDEQARFAETMLIDQTMRSFVDRVTGAGWKTIPTAYVICDDDQAIPPAMQAEMARNAGATIYHLQSSHSPYLSRPGELATLLEGILTGDADR